jgi:hypothetical protein
MVHSSARSTPSPMPSRSTQPRICRPAIRRSGPTFPTVDLGYRRLEWKCDALNAASRRAALRFGFRFEGVFRNHQIVKGRNRDTAWFAITDGDWPMVRAGFETWLARDNFDARGTQKRRLAELISA